MKKFFSQALIASSRNGIAVMSTHCAAENREEALGMAIKAAQEAFPYSEGYYNHSAAVREIDLGWLNYWLEKVMG